ncbi:MAG: hypothetical protein H7222_06175 [Methylotenera sp.]|nr:hypothetical protein [Oligoflexia bacterium]
MKTFKIVSLVLTALAIASTSLADPAPQGAMQLLARKQMGSFFPSPVANFQLTVFTDGTAKLLFTRQSGSLPVVGKVSEKELQLMKTEIAELNAAELVDPDPNAPICMDANTVAYTAFRRSEFVRELPLRLFSGCHTSNRKDHKGAQTISILDETALRLFNANY